MFIDTARIRLKAGDGGNGAVSFHREKYVAAGGPDGGDGGRGGDIVFSTDDNMATLMDFRYKREYTAPNGSDGGGRKRSGKSGAPLNIKVPRGTLIKDAETGGIIKDLSDDEPFVAARGGNGGWGNQHFATATRQAPRFAKRGLKGDELEITLELKLIADVGLIGFPNVGKSSLLAALTSANPKIADYSFTTLFPNLGVVGMDDYSFVLADIPGLIEGASEGAGLGHDFLRHVERCRLLIHVVDISGFEERDPVSDFETINLELQRHSPELASRFQIIAANKCDIAVDDELINKLSKYAEEHGIPMFTVSAAAHTGIDMLIKRTAEELTKLPPVTVYEPEFVRPVHEQETAAGLIVRRTGSGDVYTVEGEWLKRLMDNVNFSDYESQMYFNRTLEKAGVNQMLEDAGIEEGDTVSMYGMEFEFQR